MSFFQSEMTQVVEILPTNLQSRMSWVLMTQWWKEPGHQQHDIDLVKLEQFSPHIKGSIQIFQVSKFGGEIVCYIIQVIWWWNYVLYNSGIFNVMITTIPLSYFSLKYFDP